MAQRPRFFTPSQVASHNSEDDLWVSFLGRVWDLSPLLSRHRGDPLLLPLLECAGSDISSWFDPETKDLLTLVDPVTSCVRYSTPRGRVLHVPPAGPRSDWPSPGGEPWWRDRRHQVGLLGTTRWIRVVNTLTSLEQPLQVCSEETMEEVLQRYLGNNSHAHSYTWKYQEAELHMDKMLQENNMADNDAELQTLRLDPDLFTPAVMLYFNDDLTEG